MSDTERELNTSAVSGLSSKEARMRLQKQGENHFFSLPGHTHVDCVRFVATQPSIIFLLALSLLLLIFEQTEQGSLLLGLSVLYTLTWIAVRVWMGKVSHITLRTARPMVRVIRQGQMFLLDCTRLVQGDLVEIEQGDIAPCDLRLVSSQDLRVLTYLGKSSPKVEYVRCLKDAKATVSPTAEYDISCHDTMVYGGSVVECGHARALVVETDRHTYIGALQGGYPLKIEQRISDSAKRENKLAFYLRIGLLFAILPILFLCLIVGKTEESLPMLFATLMCLCLAHLVCMIDELLHAGVTVGLHRALSSSSRECALIKTEKSFEQLSQIDVLFLFGTQAFSEQIQSTSVPERKISINGKERKDEQRRQKMRLVMSENFLNSREHDLQYLRQAGITPLLFIEEESTQALTYILRTGIAEQEEEIALASRFHSEKRLITSNFGCYRAYCGFSMEEIHSLMIYLQKKNQKKVAVLGNLSRESTLLKHADVRFVCVEDMSYFTDSHRARETKPQISRGREDVATQRMRQHADVLIPCADRQHGGIAAIVHVLHTASDTTQNLQLTVDYLIYSFVLRAVFVLPAMLFGLPMLNPAQLMFSGLFLDLIFSWLFLTKVSDVASKSQRKHTWKLTVIEAVGSAVITLLAFGFIHVNHPAPESAVPALFLAMLFNQTMAFLVRWEPHAVLWQPINRKHALIMLVILLLFIPIAWIFGWMPELIGGQLASPYGYLILIGPLSVLLLSIVTRICHASHSR